MKRIYWRVMCIWRFSTFSIDPAPGFAFHVKSGMVEYMDRCILNMEEL